MPFDFHNRDRIDHLLEEIEELRYKDRRICPASASGRTTEPSATGSHRGKACRWNWAFAGKAGTATTG